MNIYMATTGAVYLTKVMSCGEGMIPSQVYGKDPGGITRSRTGKGLLQRGSKPQCLGILNVNRTISW